VIFYPFKKKEFRPMKGDFDFTTLSNEQYAALRNEATSADESVGNELHESFLRACNGVLEEFAKRPAGVHAVRYPVCMPVAEARARVWIEHVVMCLPEEMQRDIRSFTYDTERLPELVLVPADAPVAPEPVVTQADADAPPETPVKEPATCQETAPPVESLGFPYTGLMDEAYRTRRAQVAWLDQRQRDLEAAVAKAQEDLERFVVECALLALMEHVATRDWFKTKHVMSLSKKVPLDRMAEVTATFYDGLPAAIKADIQSMYCEMRKQDAVIVVEVARATEPTAAAPATPPAGK
jgi:hypothetical protein